MAAELKIFYSSEIVRGCLVCVICALSSFIPFIIVMIARTLNISAPYIFCAHLIIFLEWLNLDIILSTPPLGCLHC